MTMSTARERIVIVGGTSAIAEHCARLWVARKPVDLTLVVRDAQKAERIAADLRVRGREATVRVVTVDFVDPGAIRALVDELAAGVPIDIVLIAHGSLPDQSVCEADLVACNDALVVNAVSPALFAEAFVDALAKRGGGHLALIGSVAGDRGRRSNYVYGSAKGLVTRYAQGLQHRLANSPVRVTLIKPGPTDTPMTAEMKSKGGKLASVEDVARQIVDGIDRGSAVVYAPRKWALIMQVIRHLPAFVFNRMNI
jgi:decaprenylphospho-beta-D-erythro-pentofuranosid-2-ulose 2-reductase